MYKILEFYPGDRNGVEVELIHPGVMVKTAEISSELQDFINKIEIKDSKIYVLVNALSAGEYYGPNRNGDYIAEPVLKKYHKQFEERGHVYKHHKNKNPAEALGRILYSHYNPEMHRVELVCELDKREDESFIKRIENGEYPAVSMGMRTPYDVCSICGHKSKRLSEYCDHLRYNMNRVFPDGRKVYAINPAAKFFDLSFVIIPADATAGVMRKLASANPAGVKLSAELGEEFLKRSGIKEADLIKQVEMPADVKTITKDKHGRIFISQPLISKEDIRAMAKEASLGEICSTLMGMNIMPKPVDFQRLVLHSTGHEKLAEALDREKILLINVDKNTTPIIPNDLSLHNFNDRLAKKYAHLIPDRSLTKPLVISRILEKYAFMSETPMEQAGAIPTDKPEEEHEFFLKKSPSKVKEVFFGHTEEPKKTPYKNPILASSLLSGLFYGVQKATNAIHGPSAVGGIDAFLLRRPWMIPLLVGATTYGALKAQKDFHKEASAKNLITRYLIAVPASYIYAGMQESKVRKGEQIGDFQNIIRKHPFVTGILAGMGLGSAQKRLVKLSSKKDNIRKVVSTLSPEKVDELFYDLVN